MSVTYKQHSSLIYNLTLDSREFGDTKNISREQMKRNSFARDQGLAAHASGFDTSTLIREAARGNSILKNLHAHMGNTSTTGGCGGLGYATARGGAVTADPTYLPDGDTLLCFMDNGHIPNVEDYVMLSQIICKPNTPIFLHYYNYLVPAESDAESETINTYTDHIEAVTVAEGSTTIRIHINTRKDESWLSNRDIPISLDPAITYWFVRVYNKVTQAYELLHMLYSDRPLGRFKGEATVNNYPNMPLSRNVPFDQTHYDANISTIQKYPSTAEMDAYVAQHQPTLDRIDADTAEQRKIITDLQPQYAVIFEDISTATEEQQSTILTRYLSVVRPALTVLTLDASTFTQADLDNWEVTIASDPVLYAEEQVQLGYIYEEQDYILAAVPDVDTITVLQLFDAAVPLSAQEEVALDTITVLQAEKSAISAGAPKSDLIRNDAYSDWGAETFITTYPNYYNTMYETFMSDGFPEHAAVNRFLSMIGQVPRTMSDIVRGGVQTEVEEGDIATLCDQLTFGCQITDAADFAEIRYAIEFARSAWWCSLESTTPYRAWNREYYPNDMTSEYGRSAWSTNHIEETMLSPGHATMKSVRTQWATCEVWIEQGAGVSNGEFGAVTMTQTTAPADLLYMNQPRGSAPTGTNHPIVDDWIGAHTDAQTLEGAYNISNGLVLKIKITGLLTQAFGEKDGSRWASSTSNEYPVIPLFSNVLKSIPQMQMCQLQNEFTFIRTHTEWKQKKSSWVNFRDVKLLKILGFVLAVVGIVLALPSGGATLSWTALGTALMYAAIAYASVRVLAHFIKQWGLENTWIGAIVMVVVAVVSIYFGMPPTDAILMATTITADAMATAYAQTNAAEAREAAGKLAKLDDALDDLTDKLSELDEEQNWLDFYSASDLVKMRADAVEYVRTETPDKYYERILGYQSNMLSLDGLDYLYDHGLDLELS